MKTTTYKIIKASFIFILFLSASCFTGTPGQYAYNIPDQTDDGLETGTLSKVNIDSVQIKKAIRKIEKGSFGEVHSMLIYKDGLLVTEEYFEGHNYQWDAPKYFGELVQWDAGMKHPIMSCTKSVTSACVGIAVEMGFIDSVQQSIFDYLPEYQNLKSNNREYITIEHLLTMTCGLAWDEWSSAHGENSSNDMDRIYFADDQINFVLERPWWSAPGGFFTYNGGGIVVLGEIMKNATGMDMEEFAKKYLFEPLGIESQSWWRFPNGKLETASSLSLTPRDMLKFGALYLNNGNWNGEQILPADWVEKSSTVYHNNYGIQLPIEDSGINGYGYTWWISELEHNGEKIKMFRANGWGGQTIMVLPELDMVVVFTSGNWARKSKLFKLLNTYVLPAVED